MKSADYSLFKDYLQRDWYVQGFPAVPLFLSVAAESGIFMKKDLGFSYRHFLFNCHDTYGEMAYDPADFRRVWRIVKRKIKNNHRYLQEVKVLYHRNLRRYQPDVRQAQSASLKRISDLKLLQVFKNLVLAQRDSVGVAHIIDAIGVEIEPEFKKKLKSELPSLPSSEFNQILASCLTPNAPSFTRQEELDLMAIKGAWKNQAALKRHAAKYSWLQNSYAGAKKLTVKDFQKRLQDMPIGKKKNPATPPVPYYKFSRELRKMMDIIIYVAIWQDERKALCFQNIGYVGLVLKEISRRINFSVENLSYLNLKETESLKTLADFKSKARELKARTSGSLFIISAKYNLSASGNDYRRLLRGDKSLLRNRRADNQELRGTVANPGTAIGHVRIIKNIASLKEFKNGEVLVASMTRPEHISAMKKASAIVTNEGGLTCHAAIIARELGIPCVIGTKVATQILKNGLPVEVRANHGLIRIIG